MKKNTAKKRGWVPYVVAGLALSFVLSLLFPPDEEAPEAPPLVRAGPAPLGPWRGPPRVHPRGFPT